MLFRSLAENLGTETEAWKAARSLVEGLRGIKPGAVGDRAEFCVAKVETSLGWAAGRFFVKEAFGGESKKRGTKVITGKFLFPPLNETDITSSRGTDIIEAFKKSLKQIKWMDEESATAAAEKVNPDSIHYTQLTYV